MRICAKFCEVGFFPFIFVPNLAFFIRRFCPLDFSSTDKFQFMKTCGSHPLTVYFRMVMLIKSTVITEKSKKKRFLRRTLISRHQLRLRSSKFLILLVSFLATEWYPYWWISEQCNAQLRKKEAGWQNFSHMSKEKRTCTFLTLYLSTFQIRVALFSDPKLPTTLKY